MFIVNRILNSIFNFILKIAQIESVCSITLLDLVVAVDVGALKRYCFLYNPGAVSIKCTCCAF